MSQRPKSGWSSTGAAKSPSQGNSTLRPPWNSFTNRSQQRDVSPTVSQIRHSQTPSTQQRRSTVSPNLRSRGDQARPHDFIAPTTLRTPTRAQHYAHDTMRMPSPLQTAEPQLALFEQLKSVVVKLSQAAVGEQSKLAHMQAQLDAYQGLVREQDRMIEELRAMNAKMQKEKEAMTAFRRADSSTLFTADIQAHTPHRSRPAGGLQPDEDLNHNLQTPKTKTFVQSLVDQLREEKRLRLQVEEQSSKMIGEQQLTIYRLEDRITKSHQAPARAGSPMNGKSPRAAAGSSGSAGVFSFGRSGGASGSTSPPDYRDTFGLVDSARSAAEEHFRQTNSTASSFLKRPTASVVPSLSAQFQQLSAPIEPKEDTPVRLSTDALRATDSRADIDKFSSRSSSIEHAGGVTMESASLLLEQIKARHGL